MKKERKTRKIPVWAAVLIVLAAAAAGTAALLAGVGFYILGGIERVPVDEEELAINESLNAPPSENPESGGNMGEGAPYRDPSQVVNFAVFGVDTQDADSFSGGADTVMIASVNREQGWIRLTSILRDSWIDVDGRGSMKLTDVYRRYGPAVAIQTINRKFELNIADYVTINRYRLAEAVDLIGGVELEITQAEMEQINRYAQTSAELAAPGRVHLNGEQAAMYARIRQIDSDSQRVLRQKKLLESILARVREFPVTQYPAALRRLLGMVETSMSYSEILAYAPMLSGTLNMETRVIPDQEEKPYGGQNYPGLEGNWVWVYDYGTAAQNLHQFIYG